MRAIAFLLIASQWLASTAYAQEAAPEAEAAALNVQQMRSAELKPCEGGTKHEFTLTISGGLSLGNYEAGMNWALLKSRSYDDYRLTAVTGASAGAINALVSALAWCAADDPSTVNNNLFHDVWLPIGFDTMLPREGYAKDDLIMSRLVSHDGARKVVDDYIAARTFRNDCGPIELAVTVTGERPFYENRGDLKAPSNYYFIPITMRIENGEPFFYSNYKILDDENAPRNGLALGARDARLDRSKVLDAVIASSAFPLAFAPIELEYAQRGQTPCPKCRMKFSDGGVFDNVPLGLARALAQCTDENIYFDPDVRRTPVVGCKSDKPKKETGPTPIADTLRIYGRALATARNRILFETLRTLPVNSRPTLPKRFAPLTGDLIGSFGAWLDRDFRTYDYLAGVYDALVFNPKPAAGTAVQAGITSLKIAGEDARLLLELEAIESAWVSGAAAIKLPQHAASRPATEHERVAMVRDVMFERHLLKGGKQRVGGGFCEDELTIGDLVEGLTRRKYVRMSRSRERSDRRDVNSWIGHVNAQIAGT